MLLAAPQVARSFARIMISTRETPSGKDFLHKKQLRLMGCRIYFGDDLTGKVDGVLLNIGSTHGCFLTFHDSLK